MEWDEIGCRRVAGELLGGAGERWLHVQRVAATVEELPAVGAANHAVLLAAWLHDIGYAPELVVTGLHALDGARFLERSGAPAEVVSLVAFHTGAEYEAEERDLVKELSAFERPDQTNLDALILADLLSSPQGERVTVAKRIEEILSRYDPEHPVHRAVIRSRGYLEAATERSAGRLGYPM